MNAGKDPFTGIPGADGSEYAGTELETGQERATRIAKAAASPLNLEPAADDPADLSTESMIAELSRSTLGSEQVIHAELLAQLGKRQR